MTQNTTLAALDSRIKDRTHLSTETVADFCKKWDIASPALFGSGLRSNFRPDSDIDYLVAFTPKARKSLLMRVRIKHKLEAMTGRSVDVVSRKSVEESDN